MKIFRLLILCLGLGLFLPPTMLVAKTVSVTSAAGITVQFNDSSGRYEIRTQRPDWKFAGTLGKSARNVITESGADRLGAYQEVRFDWQAGIPLTGSIRIYDSRPVALFAMECGQAADEMPVVFPRFTSFPAGLHHFSFKNEVFAPHSFTLETNGTPWLLFDDQARAVFISPADHFMIASMNGDGAHDIASGLNPQVRHLPAHFKAATLMAFGQGINATWDTWGGALTELVGRRRPANDADAGLRYLGYWTDNGAVYYYNYEPSLGYTGTLEALVQRYAGAADSHPLFAARQLVVLQKPDRSGRQDRSAEKFQPARRRMEPLRRAAEIRGASGAVSERACGVPERESACRSSPTTAGLTRPARITSNTASPVLRAWIRRGGRKS